MAKWHFNVAHFWSFIGSSNEIINKNKHEPNKKNVQQEFTCVLIAGCSFGMIIDHESITQPQLFVDRKLTDVLSFVRFFVLVQFQMKSCSKTNA